MTDTITDTLSLDRDSLTLVVVSPDYFRTGEANHLMPNGDDESRTYYATVARGLGGEWATLIDPVDRGRLSGWDATYDYRDLVGEGHNGWNIQRRFLSPVTPDTTPDPTPESFTVGQRVEVFGWPETEPHWNGPATVTLDDGSAYVSVQPDREGTTVGAFTRDHLRPLVEEASQEATESPETAEQVSGGTFTQEDLDRAVREAREAERESARVALEEFKEMANERAVQYAEDNGLCSQFERCMEDIGLMGREEWREAHRREYSVTVEITVSAGDDEDARERAAEELAGMYSSSIRGYVTDVEEV